MSNKVLNLTYSSSLTDLCEINSSFDSGVLRIAYDGDNRNGSSISKESFMNSIQTIYNCPIVCNYDRETDTLGGHDVELVRKDDGSMSLVNLTQPVGVIPQGAKVFWDTVEEEDGQTRDYLCAEAILWKRQEAYSKLKEDGITAQSMEITVREGKMVNGVYHIDRFEFTAFALIGVEPCYESASLAFSKQEFKEEFSEMMLELKDIYKQVNTSNEVDNKNKYSMEGGSNVLNKQELITKYGIDVDAIDFSIDDFTAEELEEKFKAMTQTEEEVEEETKEEQSEETNDKFALTSNIVEEIHRSLQNEKVQREWGECARYCYIDCDFESKEVYCWDSNDWLMYGFAYELDGDNVVVDFESRKRMKYTIVEFDDGEQESPIAKMFEQIEQVAKDASVSSAEFESKYNSASEALTAIEGELEELRKFKADTENEKVVNERKEELCEMFEKFEDLNGVEAFDALKAECEEDCMKYELDALEEKCYAIRGRYGVQAKFSHEQKTPRLPIETPDNNKADEPYGGLFEKYGFSAK